MEEFSNNFDAFACLGGCVDKSEFLDAREKVGKGEHRD